MAKQNTDTGTNTTQNDDNSRGVAWSILNELSTTPNEPQYIERLAQLSNEELEELEDYTQELRASAQNNNTPSGSPSAFGIQGYQGPDLYSQIMNDLRDPTDLSKYINWAYLESLVNVNTQIIGQSEISQISDIDIEQLT